MNAIYKLSSFFISSVLVSTVARAEYTPAGQEISAAIEAYSNNLREINTLLAGITDHASADTATAPLRAKTKEMILNLRKIKQLSIDAEPSRDDQNLLASQVIEVQLLQAEFEKNCLRLADSRFFESVQLARLFYAIADVYRREQEASTPQPAAQPANTPPLRSISDEERRLREQHRNERAKLYR